MLILQADIKRHTTYWNTLIHVWFSKTTLYSVKSVTDECPLDRGTFRVKCVSKRFCREADVKCCMKCVATVCSNLIISLLYTLCWYRAADLQFYQNTSTHSFLSAAQPPVCASHPSSYSLVWKRKKKYKRWLSRQLGREGGSVNHIKESVFGTPQKNLWRTVGDWVRGMCVYVCWSKNTNGRPAVNRQLHWPGCRDSWCVDNREAVFNIHLPHSKKPPCVKSVCLHLPTVVTTPQSLHSFVESSLLWFLRSGFYV